MNKRVKFLSPILLLLFACSTVMAQVSDAPASVAAALCIKVAAYEKNIASAGDLSVYVLDDAAVAAELKKGIGQAIGKSKLAAVESGSSLPASKPSLLFVGSAGKLAEAIKYSRDNDILSVTGQPDLVSGGVTLGFGIEGGKPKIMLNLSSSVEENCDWNPAIMKVAKTIK